MGGPNDGGLQGDQVARLFCSILHLFSISFLHIYPNFEPTHHHANRVQRNAGNTLVPIPRHYGARRSRRGVEERYALVMGEPPRGVCAWAQCSVQASQVSFSSPIAENVQGSSFMTKQARKARCFFKSRDLEIGVDERASARAGPPPCKQSCPRGATRRVARAVHAWSGARERRQTAATPRGNQHQCSAGVATGA